MITGNSFSWKGESNEAHSVTVLRYPDIVLPSERAEFISVYGRSGYLTKLEGDNVRTDYILGFECMTDDASGIGDLSAWLRDSGVLTRGDMPGVYMNARVCNSIPLSRMFLSHGMLKFKVQFRCQPYLYHTYAPAVALTEPGTVTNPGNAAAEPVITITGSGAVTLTIGDQSVAVSNVDGSVIIDTPRMECYKLADGVAINKNGTMTGAFPTLAVGANAVNWTPGAGATVTSVSIDPKWRDL